MSAVHVFMQTLTATVADTVTMFRGGYVFLLLHIKLVSLSWTHDLDDQQVLTSVYLTITRTAMAE